MLERSRPSSSGSTGTVLGHRRELASNPISRVLTSLEAAAGFAANYVIPLPFLLLMAHLAGYAEVFGSWR